MAFQLTPQLHGALLALARRTRRHAVHGAPGRRWPRCSPGSAPVPTSRSAPSSPAALTKPSTTWSASSSTPWCCAPTLSGDPSFAQLLDRVRDTDLAAYAHQDVPFERLVEELNPARSPSRHPLFQVMIAFNNTAARELDLATQRTSLSDGNTGVARFDLLLLLTEQAREDGDPGGIAGTWEFATDLFDRQTVTAIAERLPRLLAAVIAEPELPLSQIDVLMPARAAPSPSVARARGHGPAGERLAARGLLHLRTGVPWADRAPGPPGQRDDLRSARLAAPRVARLPEAPRRRARRNGRGVVAEGRRAGHRCAGGVKAGGGVSCRISATHPEPRRCP